MWNKSKYTTQKKLFRRYQYSQFFQHFYGRNPRFNPSTMYNTIYIYTHCIIHSYYNVTNMLLLEYSSNTQKDWKMWNLSVLLDLDFPNYLVAMCRMRLWLGWWVPGSVMSRGSRWHPGTFWTLGETVKPVAAWSQWFVMVCLASGDFHIAENGWILPV